MESFTLRNVSFTYPNRTEKTLSDINLSVQTGEFVTVCGASGCGKTTLLRLLKKSLAPYGKQEGEILFGGKALSALSADEEAAKIGFVMQNPENQVVTDKVWHELSFGLESLGVPSGEIRARVSEMASFFGIENWFYKNVSTLSGGQKQLLNLASCMVMQPSVLLLDEPTSQLDPIHAREFIDTLQKINRELGLTIILTEHRLEELLPVSDRMIVMDNGKIICDGAPKHVGEILRQTGHPMQNAMPVPMRVGTCLAKTENVPLTVREGRTWLTEYVKTHAADASLIPKDAPLSEEETVLFMKDVYFRYEKEGEDVLSGLSLSVKRGEIFALLGGNGTGKTTTLRLLAGLAAPLAGEMHIKGGKEGARLGVLPQNPTALFSRKTVWLELAETAKEVWGTAAAQRMRDVIETCGISHLLESHPYDLSGGEQTRAALAKVLLRAPEILLLDEPTKGMDAMFKETFACILQSLKNSGVSIFMVSHDIEFCAEYADRCALMFGGGITSEDTPRRFFAGKSFYTTAANRMARSVFPNAVLCEDIIKACGGTPPEKPTLPTALPQNGGNDVLPLEKEKKRQPLQLSCPLTDEKNKRRQRNAALFLLFVLPLTLFLGMKTFGNRKYYITSLLLLLETMLPFLWGFEKRKPRAREVALVSTLCAICVASRAAFFMAPQFKPMAAVVMITGLCLGGETGFLVGAVSGFVSNFFFGQGPWTPWQMVGLGFIGLFAGILSRLGWIRKTKGIFTVFGFLFTLILYGGIVNLSSVMMWQMEFTWEMLAFVYLKGLPFDLVHAASTAFFLWFTVEPMVEIIERVKIKYGLLRTEL